MHKQRKQRVKAIVCQSQPGVSFSIKNCREYGVDWVDALNSTLGLGFRRFRLMSYWDEHETTQGIYDFTNLKKQLIIISSAGGQVTMSIGMRQPRWPETHIPDWAKALPKDRAELAFFKFLEATINALKDEPIITSWQLENEYWLRSFGEHFDFSRPRLVAEFNLLRRLDPNRPIIMSLANTFSLPMGAPKPDLYATSIYRNLYDHGLYRKTHFAPWYYRMRRYAIKLLCRRELIIHELQTEPWGPQANWEMTDREQAKSMDPTELQAAIDYAQKTGITYMDLWGAEWWYWRQTSRGDGELARCLRGCTNGDKAI